jgi:hypothetical protein
MNLLGWISGLSINPKTEDPKKLILIYGFGKSVPL